MTLQPKWAYFCLQAMIEKPDAASLPLGLTQVRVALLHILSAHLGDFGAAVPVDILHVTSAVLPSIYLRVPCQDAHAVTSALASASSLSSQAPGAISGFTVIYQSAWLPNVLAPSTASLFDFTAAAEGETAVA